MTKLARYAAAYALLALFMTSVCAVAQERTKRRSKKPSGGAKGLQDIEIVGKVEQQDGKGKGGKPTSRLMITDDAGNKALLPRIARVGEGKERVQLDTFVGKTVTLKGKGAVKTRKKGDGEVRYITVKRIASIEEQAADDDDDDEPAEGKKEEAKEGE